MEMSFKRVRNQSYAARGGKMRPQVNTDAVSQVLPSKEMLVGAVARVKSPASLEKVGIHVSRYGLVITLLLIGVLKFTAAEAHGIQPLIANSPLMSWLYRVFSLQAVSSLIGIVEIIVALLIALRPFSAKISFIGSLGAIIIFVLTVSFLFSTPGAFEFTHGLPVLGDAGQFLIKDVVLLGASIWTAAESRNAF
jgi:uncharacterized membrane protein YkgB